jgi:hypothetical protein
LSPTSTLTLLITDPRSPAVNPVIWVAESGALTATSVASAPPERYTPWLTGCVRCTASLLTEENVEM